MDLEEIGINAGNCVDSAQDTDFISLLSLSLFSLWPSENEDSNLQVSPSPHWPIDLGIIIACMYLYTIYTYMFILNVFYFENILS